MLLLSLQKRERTKKEKRKEWKERSKEKLLPLQKECFKKRYVFIISRSPEKRKK